MKENIFLYIRDSKGNQKWLDKQEKELRKFVEENFKEANISLYQDNVGVLNNREGLNNLLSDIKEKNADWVVVSHIDRLYKIMYENGFEKLNEIVDRILENGAGLISVREGKILRSNRVLEELSRQINEAEEEI